MENNEILELDKEVLLGKFARIRQVMAVLRPRANEPAGNAWLLDELTNAVNDAQYAAFIAIRDAERLKV